MLGNNFVPILIHLLPFTHFGKQAKVFEIAFYHELALVMMTGLINCVAKLFPVVPSKIESNSNLSLNCSNFLPDHCLGLPFDS